MSFSGRIFSDLLSTLLSMQARGGGVDRKNPLFWLFRFKRLVPKSASQIKAEWPREIMDSLLAATLPLNWIYLKLLFESIVLNQPADEI